MIPHHFHRINAVQPGTPSLLLPGLTSSPPPAKPAEPPLRARERARHTPCTLYTGTHVSTAHCVGTHQQSYRSFPRPQGGTNLYGNRIPSTIPFPRQAPDLTRHYVSLHSTLKCEGNMVCRYSGVLRKDRWDHIGKSFRVRSLVPDPISDSGTPGTTHRHVTGPQVVPRCSLQEQPSVHAIRIPHRLVTRGCGEACNLFSTSYDY